MKTLKKERENIFSWTNLILAYAIGVMGAVVVYVFYEFVGFILRLGGYNAN